MFWETLYITRMIYMVADWLTDPLGSCDWLIDQLGSCDWLSLWVYFRDITYPIWVCYQLVM